MQAPEEDDDGRGGVEGSAGSPSGPEGAGSPSGPEGAGSPSGPEAAGSSSGLEGAVGPGDQNNPREESPAAEGAPEAEGASQYSAEAAVASTSHSDLGSPLSEFTLTVPFLSYLEAEVVRGYLMAGAETHHGRVHWDLTVTGCDLFIRLASEDPDLLQISTASLLDRLSIAVQIMQHFVPPFCVRHHPQNGS
ncbi:EKC/KEOPS complex subunit LAGE3-like [Eptesicus fuscus]|uniref:EKC/KEOPS complex subunit LAGE3-like n=1 Tax=Eptesicus fuscus TaxID=29078 RepID=UPI0024046E96|nr:EKC/KEOPS complex subunit LAGE3-like [Eptesicus fuscus]